MKKVIVLSIILLIQSCAAVNVRTDKEPENHSLPTFEKTYTYWLFGVKGKHAINVREVCVGRSVEQIQTVDTILDSFYRVITIGIYWPRTARIWCGDSK